MNEFARVKPVQGLLHRTRCRTKTTERFVNDFYGRHIAQWIALFDDSMCIELTFRESQQIEEWPSKDIHSILEAVQPLGAITSQRMAAKQ